MNSLLDPLGDLLRSSPNATPAKTSVFRVFSMTVLIVLSTSGWRGLPLWPIDPARSIGPTQTLVSPGTAKISSRLLTASMCSI